MGRVLAKGANLGGAPSGPKPPSNVKEQTLLDIGLAAKAVLRRAPDAPLSDVKAASSVRHHGRGKRRKRGEA